MYLLVTVTTSSSCEARDTDRTYDRFIMSGSNLLDSKHISHKPKTTRGIDFPKLSLNSLGILKMNRDAPRTHQISLNALTHTGSHPLPKTHLFGCLDSKHNYISRRRSTVHYRPFASVQFGIKSLLRVCCL